MRTEIEPEASSLLDRRPTPVCSARHGSAVPGPEASTLWVGLNPPEEVRAAGGMAYASGVEALAALRLVGADLVFVGPGISDMVPGEFAEQMRSHSPRQRWVLVSPALDATGEVEARSLGALAVLDATPTGRTCSGYGTRAAGNGQWGSVLQSSGVAKQGRRQRSAALNRRFINKGLVLTASVGAAVVSMAGSRHPAVPWQDSPVYGITDLGLVSDQSWSDDPGAGSPAFRADLIADAPFTCTTDTGALPDPAARGFTCRQGDAGRAVGYYRLPGDGRDHAFEREHGWSKDLGTLYSDGTSTGLGTGTSTALGTGTSTGLGTGASRACSVNRAGDVVGWAVAEGGAPHAFLLHGDSAMTDMHVSAPGLCSIAQDINDSGTIVGTREIGDATRCHAFLVRSGTYAVPLDLGTLGGNSSHAYRINSAGWVVGSAQTASGAEHAFLYDGLYLRDMNEIAPKDSGWELQRAYCINDHQQIAGVGLLNGERHAFVLTPVIRKP